MLTLSKPISAGQAQAYHRSEFANAKENYYTEGERVRGVWQGQLAERYGAGGPHLTPINPWVPHISFFEMWVCRMLVFHP